MSHTQVEQQCQFHIGELVTSLQLVKMHGGKDVILYGTIMGSIGALLPFKSRDDIDFFSHLETSLRAKAPPLCGRHHIAYRSSFIPVKVRGVVCQTPDHTQRLTCSPVCPCAVPVSLRQAVIDGDYCERFSQLPSEKQRDIAEELDRRPADVLKKLEETRNLIL